jgi:RecB family exonuclease
LSQGHPPHPNSFSPTAIGLYEQCPRSYAHAYLFKTEVEDPPSAHLIFGNALHAALAFLFRLPPEDRSAEMAHRALRHFWLRQEGRDRAFLTKDEEATWGQAALAALSRFCSERAEELAIKPLAVEEWVRATVDFGHSVAGKVDRVERLKTYSAGEGQMISGLRVTDYKSGKPRIVDPDDLARDRAAQIYALATWQTFQ